MNFFDQLNDGIRNTEGSISNLLSSIAPYGAPIPAAVMSFMHMQGVLGFQPWVAFVVAITIEILGFSTISTWMSFWSWNRRFKSESSIKRAPMGFVIGAFVFYLIIVISMNVALDAAQYFPEVLNEHVVVIIVRGSLTLLTIPAGLIVATRVQHHELLDEIKKSKDDKRSVPVPSSTGTGIPRNSANKKAVYDFLNNLYTTQNRVASFTEVRDTLHIPQGSASRLRKEWMKDHNI